MWIKTKPFVLLLVVQAVFPVVFSDNCLIRDYGSNRKVCVCNKNTCDTLEAVKKIEQGQFLRYTTDRAGQRFAKETGKFLKKGVGKNRIVIQSNQTFQKIIGFGGTITDTTGVNVLSLSADLQNKFMRSYFSEEGIEYNIIRVPMGGSDFSVRAYSYDDADQEDPTLSKFALATEDLKYKIPYINIAQNLTKNNIKLFGSLWSAPKWIKTNGKFLGGAVKDKFYQVYANYFVKFLEEYKKKGIKYWAITTGNEPSIHDERYSIPSVAWTPQTLKTWVRDNLGPTIRKSEFSDITLLILDEGRGHLTGFTNSIFGDPETAKYTDGVAVHWYNDPSVPVQVIVDTHKNFSDKLIFYSEASKGLRSAHPIQTGNWVRGEGYALSIIENTNNWVIGFTDWNMAVNMKGGPTFVGNPIDAPILVNATAQEFLKQPIYYAIGHFSKFVPRDSENIKSSTFAKEVAVAAYKRPDGGITVVMVNTNETTVDAVIEDANRGEIPVTLTPKSFTTIVYW